MTFNIQVAGHIFEIHSLFSTIKSMCFGYIIDNVTTEPRNVIKISIEDIIKVSKIKNLSVTQYNIGKSELPFRAAFYETLVVQQKIANTLLAYDTILMHGAVVAKDGYAYMFTASSGVGKTTRAKLMLNEYPGTIVVNGDKPFIKITDSKILACGSPWCGKEGWNTNIEVPLCAIFLLERADNENKTTIEEVSLGEAYSTLLQQMYNPDTTASMQKSLRLLKDIEGKVRIFKYRSIPTRESIQLAYETARPK